MKDILHSVNSPLFYGIKPEDLKPMLSCIGYHIGTFKKGDIVAFEDENIKHIGIIISGAVDMINVGMEYKSGPIEQVADVVERAPEIIAKIKAFFAKLFGKN